MASQLYARDVDDAPSRSTHLVTTDLLADAGRLFAGLSGAELTSLAHDVEKQYAREGSKLIWTVLDGVPTYNSPIICRLPGEAWSLTQRTGSWSIKLVFARRVWVVTLDETRARRAQVRLRLLARATRRDPAEIYEGAPLGRPTSAPRRTEILVRLAAPEPDAPIDRY